MNHQNIAALKNIDIRTVDPKKLIDISEIDIDHTLPDEQRMIDFLHQIKNPYCYKNGKWIVQVGFIKTGSTLEEKMRYVMT